MLISLLVQSFEDSVLGRALTKIGIQKLVKESLSYRVIIAVHKLLVKARDYSAFLKALAKLCDLSGIRSREVSLTTEFRSEGGLADRALSPLLLPATFLLFFWASLVRVAPLTLVTIYASALAMIGGILLARLERDLPVANSRGIVALIGTMMFLLGYAAFILQMIRVGGVPLLNDELRRGLSPLLNYLAWSTIPGTAYLLSSLNLKRCEAFFLTFIGFIPSLFIAFRTGIVAYILAVTTVLFYRRIIGKKHLIMGFAVASLFFVGVGAVRAVTTGLAQNPLLSVLYRPTITTAALDSIVRLYSLRPVTNGWVHLAALSSLGLIKGTRYGPRTLIGIYVGGRRDISTTATLIGGPLLDWGLLGALLVSFLYSYLLSVSYRFARKAPHLLGPYATLLSYLVVGVETGILDINVYAYFTISTLLVIGSLRASR